MLALPQPRISDPDEEYFMDKEEEEESEDDIFLRNYDESDN
jgi:hypothetical protein